MLPTPDTKISCAVILFENIIRFWKRFEATMYFDVMTIFLMNHCRREVEMFVEDCINK
jgi:hypothetical protein